LGSFRSFVRCGRPEARDDSVVIADQARMRRDLKPLVAGDEIAVDLKILSAGRLAVWLKHRKVRNASAVAVAAVAVVAVVAAVVAAAVEAQYTVVAGEISAFGTVGRLAGVIGLAPVSKDSVQVSGNLRRPRRYNRRLLRVCCLAAQVAAMRCPVSKPPQPVAAAA
jgi:hypothetical protein